MVENRMQSSLRVLAFFNVNMIIMFILVSWFSFTLQLQKHVVRFRYIRLMKILFLFSLSSRRRHMRWTGDWSSDVCSSDLTGVLKNALDWLVSFEGFVDKRVAIFNASPRSVHADAQLREILTTMSADLDADACLALPFRGTEIGRASCRERV